MNKLFLFLPLFFMINTSFADAMIFNKGKNDIEATYRFCYQYFSNNKYVCSGEKVITVPGAQNKKIYAVIQAPEMPADKPDVQLLDISSAIAKDLNGNVISQSDYTRDGDIPGGICSTYVSRKNNDKRMLMKNVIILDDMNQSPVIVCEPYAVYGGWTEK